MDRIKYFTEMKVKNKLDKNDIKFILENIITEKSLDIILFLDICNYSIQNLLYEIIPTLTNLLKIKIIKSNYLTKFI